METKWEYQIMQGSSPSVKDLTTVLNNLGDQGWEMVGVYASPGNVTAFYFKRPKATQAAAQSNFGR